ncbi:DUF2062 domain-containing protein [Lacinutrix sp. 5H-3-7-4]|uniref:DUF2062 domain-containing protein n=1 Tax=Lacinutrix sp. (strain 5H-3-7-4) TaxID=983544 RepID=UPI00020A3D04|nr:DUF2062 domain-containing protein [Lacinutrix sp. 5H-3-7-4]AEH01939.1 glycosyl transferase family 2 [Lacinutrix sp. 5H-3-7-4]
MFIVEKKLLNLKFKKQNICVLIPTYNNAATLKRVIDGVLEYTDNLLIVNDGSTDATPQILENYTTVKQLHIPENKGKGNALREGFTKAESLGYTFAITIDSDGQHYPNDLHNFITGLENAANDNVIIVGARNMEQANIPGKSSFGHKFSNFWYWFETGIKLTDTQSGYRLYNLKAVNALNLVTNKFEYEIEIIVKAAWKGIDVFNVPVKVLYDKDERVSHFRPFRDFTRVSIINTYFVILAIFFYKPRQLFRNLKKKGIKRFFLEDFLGQDDSPLKKALSIALGVFIGLSPFWGFHTVIVLFLAVSLNLNKAIAFAFSNVSLPPFIPFVLYASVKVGQFFMGEKNNQSMSEMIDNFEVITHLQTYLIGSFSLAVICAITFGCLGYFILKFFERKPLAITNA